MRQWAIIFSIFAVVFAVLGFIVLSDETATVAQFSFVIFTVLAIAAVIFDNRELNY